MALRKIVKCSCQFDYSKKVFPELIDRPYLCPWCHGSGKTEFDVHLRDDYEGKFERSDTFLSVDDDILIEFECACGETMRMYGIGGDPIVCKCGRIYRTNWTFEVDESHIGETNWIIEQSKGEYEEIIYE